ncbi:glycosyltransferase 87 family protein [Actinomyces sp. ZJ308]|uniref:glycosyltransferase 87 family protein n=1 Tax=Actinomyces sp. ZJ308 TaxID=2708342 RepID=UPI001422CDF8|nr:glycosyltransferase 87 family protein [Actinomyces sp. ZJ308]
MDIAPPRWSATSAARALIALWSVVTVVGALLDSALQPELHIDFLVYRAGAQHLLDGQPLYAGPLDTGVPGFLMHFTYPPFGAALLCGAAISSPALAAAVHTAASLVALFVLSRIVVARCGGGAWTALAAANALALLMPVVSHLTWGQVGLFLIALLAADWLPPRTAWPRGLLTGIAIAIKLTPAVFLLLPLLRRDRRALLVSLASAAVCTGIGFLIAPRESLTFWGSAMWDSTRVASSWWDTENQSLRGLLSRVLPGPLSSVVWLVLAVVVVIIIAGQAARLTRRGDDLLAFGVVGLIAPIVSPVAWVHHWVFALPLIMTLVWRAVLGLSSDARRPGWETECLAAVGSVVVMLIAPTHFPDQLVRYDSPQWSPLAVLASGAYVYWAAATMVIVARLGAGAHRIDSGRSRAGEDQPPSGDDRSAQSEPRPLPGPGRSSVGHSAAAIARRAWAPLREGCLRWVSWGRTARMPPSQARSGPGAGTVRRYETT